MALFDDLAYYGRHRVSFFDMLGYGYHPRVHAKPAGLFGHLAMHHRPEVDPARPNVGGRGGRSRHESWRVDAT